MTKVKRLSDIHTNVDTEDKQDSLIERKEIETTPFEMVKLDHRGWFGTMGKWRITEEYETEKELREDLEKITWNRILQIVALVTEQLKQQ